MYKLIPYKTCFIISLVLMLSACATGQQKNEQAAINIDEVEKLAAAAYERGDMVESEKYYAQLVRELPQEVLPLFRLGNVYAATNRPDAAIIAYREVLIRDPYYSKAWFNMAIVQLKQSAHSFHEMQIYIDASDPLYKRSKETLDGILELIKGDDNKN